MNQHKEENNRLSTNSLANLIVDALVDAKIISKEDIDKSIEIVTNEIEARKALGDY